MDEGRFVVKQIGIGLAAAICTPQKRSPCLEKGAATSPARCRFSAEADPHSRLGTKQQVVGGIFWQITPSPEHLSAGTNKRKFTAVVEPMDVAMIKAGVTFIVFLAVLAVAARLRMKVWFEVMLCSLKESLSGRESQRVRQN